MPTLRNRVYYRVKPFVPQSLRTAIRRRLATRLRSGVADIWPVAPGSERPPEDWPGWPQGKKFALVLTHDVETTAGLHRCRQLMELELEMGVRSSFNFVPEGEYRVPRDLRAELTRNGFEIGIHDLKHDGRLYESRRSFNNRAARINSYLQEWGAVGFRSAFMLHELDWLHEMNIEYDASTFDTDPFEPQPHGRETIFPFWILPPRVTYQESRITNHQSPVTNHAADPSSVSRRRGYIELPYTLPQDSTLFLLFREETPEIWFRKLDWIAEKGGMALVISHPDYMTFGGRGSEGGEYPVELYRQLLRYVKDKYADTYWHPLAREMAAYARQIAFRPRPSLNGATGESVAGGIGQENFYINNRWRLHGKRAAVLLFSYYPADPRPRRAAEALASEGVKVHVVCLQRDRTEPRREVINGVHVLRVPLKRQRGSKIRYVSQYAVFILRSFIHLAGRSLIQRYDFVHVHNMPDILVSAALIPKLLGARIILDLHDPMPELMMSIYHLDAETAYVRWLKRLEKFSISFAHLVLTPNKAFSELFISRSCASEKIEIVMNSPESNIFHSSGRESASSISGNRDGTFKVMYHGLIAERHGLDTALEAIASLRSAIPGLEFHIFGDRTPYMDQVESQLRLLGLEGSVQYHGYQTQTEIAKSICSVDLGVIPNRRDPFTELNMPTRIFEYLAIGKPAIVPNTKGIRDYFGADSAFFFEPGDSQSLSEAILDVYRNPKKADLVVARGKAIYEGHRWDMYRARFLDQVAVLLEDDHGLVRS